MTHKLEHLVGIDQRTYPQTLTLRRVESSGEEREKEKASERSVARRSQGRRGIGEGTKAAVALRS